MLRTIINLDETDRRWLDRESKATRLPMTELVRRAVKLYRIQQESRECPDLHRSLAETSGIWRHGDGLAYQDRLRDEWGRW
ncbi:MAG: hypothetical protein L0H73_05770 [Nitrococcus sp.]|nr:hypothetical protein [Nitrococcus sp.]